MENERKSNDKFLGNPPPPFFLPSSVTGHKQMVAKLLLQQPLSLFAEMTSDLPIAGAHWHLKKSNTGGIVYRCFWFIHLTNRLSSLVKNMIKVMTYDDFHVFLYDLNVFIRDFCFYIWHLDSMYDLNVFTYVF